MAKEEVFVDDDTPLSPVKLSPMAIELLQDESRVQLAFGLPPLMFAE
jgi:hypothetical protein